MNRTRAMRRNLLASTAIVTALSVAPARSETVVDGGIAVLYMVSATDSQLTLIDGVIAGNDGTVTFEATSLFDMRKGTAAINLTGTGSLVKSTSDIVWLSGTNTYTGGTTVNAGTLVLQAGNALWDLGLLTINGGNVQLDANETIGSLSGAGTLSLNSYFLTTGGDNTSSTYSGLITGTGGLVKSGTGVFTLSGNNTFSGGIEVAQGTLRLASNGAAGTGPITTTGSVIDYGAGVNNAAPIILNSNTTQLQVTSSATQSGVISEIGGSRPLEKIGNGVLTMTAANTYTGTTTISAGRIILSGAGEILGNVHIANNSPNDFFQISKNSNYTYGGVISGYNVALTGTGTTTWTGANTHAYTGITDGTLTFSGAGTLGASNTWVLMSGGTVDLNGTTQSAGIFTLYDGGSGLVTNGNLNVSSVFYADSGTMAANLGGTAVLAKFSGGTSYLSGNNTYTGSTQLNGGTLVAQGGNAISNASAVTIASGATLQLGNDETIASLAGAGNVALTTRTLTTGGSNGSTTFSGVVSGSGGLTKAGTGVFTMTGANTYTGTTTISAGRIILSGAGEILGNVHIANNSPNDFFEISKNSNFTYGGAISGYNVALTGSGTTTWTGANTHAYTGITNGTLTFSGAGTLGASNTWVLMSGGTVDLNGTTQSAGIFTLYDGGSGLVTNGNLNVSSVFYADSGTMAANLGGTATVAKFSAGTSIMSGNNSYTGSTQLNGGTLVVQGGNAITNTSAVTIASGATLQLDNDETIGSLAGAGNVALTTRTLTTGGNGGGTTFSGVMSGSGGLTKAGTGNFVLSGANTYTGLTTVTNGRLQLGTGGAIAGDIHIVNNGQAWFDFNQSGSYTYSGVLSGGQISRTGSGSLTLTGANSNNYLGIGGGTVTVSGGGTFGASNMTVGLSGFGSTATLDLGGTTQNISLLTMFAGWDNAVVNGTLNASTFLFAEEGLISANLTGTATLVKNGGGTTTLSGSNTYTGQTTINAGTLVLQGGNAIDNANAVSIAAGATLQLDGDETIGSLAGAGTIALTTKTLTAGGNNASTSWSGTISGGLTSGLQKTGTGTLSVTGNMNQESTTVAGGELNFNGTALGNIAVNLGARLSGTNTITGNLINLGTVASGNSPGTTTVLGNYTGGGILDVEVQFDNAGTPINGVTHDFLDISGNVSGAPTSVNILTFAPSATPAATVGNGIQIVRVGGTTTGSDFTMTSYLLGSYYYDVAYIANYSGTDDGYFLQSSLATPGCSVGGGDDACFVDSSTNQATPVNALGGNDTLQLTGATNFNFDVSTIGTVYTNFEVFQKADTSTVTLTGVAGLTTLGFDVQNGTLIAGTNQLGSQGRVNVFTPGTLEVSSDLTVGSIAGTGTINLAGGDLFTGGDNTSSTFSGILAGSQDLVKLGSGTLTLSGANTNTGLTWVLDGTLQVDGGSAIDDLSRVIVDPLGTLRLLADETIGSLEGTLISGGTVDLGSNTLTLGGNDYATLYLGPIIGTGGLTKVGNADLTLGGTNTYSGATQVNGGTLTVEGGTAIADASAVSVGIGATLVLNASETIGSLDGAGNVSLGGNLTTGGNDNSTLYSGSMSGTGQLVKAGTGAMTLTGANTHSGGTNITGGNLTTGGNDNSTLYSGSMSGTGQLVKAGTGAMTLTGANTHSGGTNITGGILQVSGIGTLGAISGSLGLSAGAGLDLGGTSQTVGSFTSSGAVYNGTLTVSGLTTLFAGNASANLNLATLNKSGAGAATLSGTNSTGAVNVLGGSLVLSGGSAISDSSAVSVAAGSNLVLSTSETIGSLTGAGGVSLGGGTLLTTGGNNTSTTFSGAISGTGKLVKTGSGLFTLGGLNSFSGGIDILHGGIRLLNSNAAGTGPITTYGSVISYANAVNNAAPIIVSSNTTQLEVLAADVATQSGAISEAGGSRPLEKIGTGTLTLSGFNTYTGATTITAGTLNVTGGSALSNSAAVNVAGAGTLSVTGSETIGSLSGSGTLNLGAGATLTTGADNTSSVFSGTSSGLGDLTKTGAGTMTLTGTNSFAGVLAVAGGNLTVTPSGSLNGMSSFNVLGGASAFLGGSVQGVNGGGMTGAGLGALSVSTGGTLYLDDNTSLSGATLNLASGSNLNLFLTTNTSQYPQISLSGSANIANANVGVYLDPISFSGTLATSFTYSNVITGSGVTGTFGSVNLLQSPSGLFSVSGIYTPTSAGIQVTRNAFSTLGGGGPNQTNVGDAIEDIFVNGPTDPDILNLINVIGLTPAGGVPAIYTLISGAENAENTGNSLRTDDPWKQSVAERVNAARTTGCTVAGETWCLRRYAQATTNGGDVMSDIQGDPTAFDWLETGIRDTGSFSVWGRIIGAWGETSGDVNGPGSTQTTGGFIGGADHVFNSLLLAGVAMQYVETDVDYDQSRNGSLIRSGQMGAYVSYGGAEAFVNGNISVIGAQASAKRFMSIGLIDYDVESLARSWTVTASVEGGTIMEIDGYRFEPSLAFNYQAAHPLDFEEKGGGGLSLIVRPDDSQSLRSILSARMSRVYDVGDRKLVPQLRIDWRHEMLDRRQEFSAAFAGDPTVFFDIDGAVYARDVFAAGASVTMPITGRITGYVDAQGAFSEDSTSAMVSVGGRATW